MYPFQSDRRLWFAVAFLVLNACGWWWVKSESGGRRAEGREQRSEGGGPQVERPAAVLTPLALMGIEQTGLASDRRMTLSLTFSGPVDWTSLSARLKVMSEGAPLGWQYVGKSRANACQIRTDAAVCADRIEVRLAAGVAPASRDYAATAETVVREMPVVPEFRFSGLESSTPPFGQPAVVAHFTQAADAGAAAAFIACEPPVSFTIIPETWGNGLVLTGPFATGEAYTFVFKAGLRSRDGHALEKEVRRTVQIRHREPSVSIPVEGRYLAPDGELTVPVLAVNATNVVSSLARVLPQNLVQYAMREAGLYSGWWRDEPSDLAHELTVRPAVRTNVLDVARDQEQRLMLRLSDYGQARVRGVYVLEVEAPDVQPRSRLVCVTDLGLSARSDGEAVTVWVTALRTGLPASGVRVELFGRNNLTLAQGVSDAQGLVRLGRKNAESEPFLVVAQTSDGGDLSVLPLTDSQAVEQRCEAERGYLAPGACEAFVLSDRDIYRHGESVFVQALLRKADGRPPAPFPVALQVNKPDGRTFKTISLMPDALGAVFTQVTLPDYLPSGTYRFELRVPGGETALGGHAVILESFVPPQIRVAVRDVPAGVRAGDRLAFSVAAEHLFGKPAAGLGAEATLTYRAADFKPDGWEGFLFGDAEKKSATSVLRCPKQTLAEDGTAAFAETVAIEGLPPARMRAVVQATVTETGGRTVSARAEATVDPYPFYIGIKSGPERLIRVGAPCAVTLAAVNPDGTRQPEKRPAAARVERVTWVSGMRKEPSGRYLWESERVKTVVSEAVVEIGGADVLHTFQVEAAGEYVITFTEPVSKASSSWAFAAGAEGQSQVAWDRASPDRVELVFDKPAYRSGETARLQVRAPFAGQAWVTVNNDRLLESRVFALTNNTGTLEWPVTDAFVPNVEVAVSVVRPAVAESVWSAHRASGEAVLRVLPPERQLTVRVQPASAVWRPKSELPVRISVSDSAGLPARGASVTVFAVDEGVCLLTDYQTPDPNGFFLAARTGNLSFHDVYRTLMPITSESMFGSASHIGGDGGGELMKRLNPVAARRFKPLARWQANVKADDAGVATVPFALPEFAGELRLTAVAWNERAVGSAASSVKVKRKLVVQPDLPRFLAPGDRAHVLVALHNESGAACSARVAVRTEGPLVCDAPAQEVALKAGESRTLQVPVAAQGRAGTARVTVRAEGAGEVYEEPVEVAVRPAAALRSTAEHLVLKPGEERTFEPPHGALEDSFKQTFFCSGQPDVNLLGALDYVANYPYGCLEQTVSAVLPLLSLRELAERLPARESTLAQEAPDRINAALLRVLSMQRWSGFAMWPDAWETHPQMTVYAAFFLVQAAQAGYALPRQTVPEVLKTLRGRLSDDHVSRAYICHVLALAGQPDHGWMLRLYEQLDTLGMEDRFHLARALIRAGEVRKGRDVLAESRSVKGLREAAFALLAWLEIDPANPAVAVCCREIERARRREGHWGTTQDNALALLAMGAYVRQTPERPQVFTPVFRWGDQTHAVSATNACTWAPGAEAGSGAVRVRNEGPGPMHVTRHVSYVPLAANVEIADSGLKVRREWLDLQGAPAAPETWKRGDLLIVRLRLDPMGEQREDLVIEELLPAGLEIENAQVARAGTLPWVEADEAEWVLHREARDDRLLLFSKRVGKPQQFHYAARVVSPGEFVVPPVSAAAMYDPDTFSRSGSDRATVR